MSKNRQALNFELVRSGQLSIKELGVLQYINSYSSYCAPRQIKQMADKLQSSDRSVRRIINSLVAKGLIIKKYTIHKRVILIITSLAEQAKLIGMGMVNKVLSNTLKRKKKVSHRSGATEILRAPLTESIKEENIKEQNNNKDGIFLNSGIKTLGGDAKRRDTYSEVMRFVEHLNQKALLAN